MIDYILFWMQKFDRADTTDDRLRVLVHVDRVLNSPRTLPETRGQAVEFLQSAIHDSTPDICQEASRMLARHLLLHSEWDALRSLLEGPFPVRYCAASVVYEALLIDRKKAVFVARLESDLHLACAHENEQMNAPAFRALAMYYASRHDWVSLLKLLHGKTWEPGRYVSEWDDDRSRFDLRKARSTAFFVLIAAMWEPPRENSYYLQSVLKNIIMHIRSIQTLNAIQTLLEECAQAWNELHADREPAALSARICGQRVTTEWIGRVAERKSVLAKRKDGELLAGETIPISRSSRIYGAVRVRG